MRWDSFHLDDSLAFVAFQSIGVHMINLQQSHSFCSHHSWTWALSHRAACTSHTLQLHTDNLNSKTVEKRNHSDGINFMYVELLDNEEKHMMEGK